VCRKAVIGDEPQRRVVLFLLLYGDSVYVSHAPYRKQAWAEMPDKTRKAARWLPTILSFFFFFFFSY